MINKQGLGGEKVQEQMKDTLTHEVGHQAYFKFLPEADRKDWGKLSGDRPRRECINEYARKNQYEDFAVSYRAYVWDPETLKQVSQEKYNFIGIRYLKVGNIRRDSVAKFNLKLWCCKICWKYTHMFQILLWMVLTNVLLFGFRDAQFGVQGVLTSICGSLVKAI